MSLFRQTIIWSLVAFAVLFGPTIGAQAVQAAAGAPMPTSDASEWGNSFMWAIGSSWIMRILRENPRFSKFSEWTPLRYQRLVGSAIAFLNGLGISFVFDGAAGQLVISGLLLDSVLHGLRQFLFQEFVYHAAIKRPTPVS